MRSSPDAPVVQDSTPNVDEDGTLNVAAPGALAGATDADGDPITAGGQHVFEREVPGAAGQRHVTITGGGHFLQEDRGPEFAAVIVDFIAANP